MRNLIVRFIKEEDGMEMVEWALVAGLVCMAALVVVVVSAGSGAWVETYSPVLMAAMETLLQRALDAGLLWAGLGLLLAFVSLGFSRSLSGGAA